MQDRDVSETLLLVLFLGIAGSFIALTTTFRSDSAKLFPRITGGIIIVGGLLILAADRLPESVRWIVEEPVDLVDRDEFEEYESDEGETAEPSADETTEESEIPEDPSDEESDATIEPMRVREESRLTSRQFTFAAIAGYVGASYLLSILVATPLFVVVYGLWYRQSKWTIGVLTVVSIGVCWLLMELANAPLDQSWFFPRGFL